MKSFILTASIIIALLAISTLLFRWQSQQLLADSQRARSEVAKTNALIEAKQELDTFKETEKNKLDNALPKESELSNKVKEIATANGVTSTVIIAQIDTANSGQISGNPAKVVIVTVQAIGDLTKLRSFSQGIESGAIPLMLEEVKYPALDLTQDTGTLQIKGKAYVQ